MMMNNVLEYEPRAALFVTDDSPLMFYEAILDYAKDHLEKDGRIYFEINEYLGEEMYDLLESKNYKEIILKKDIFEKDRMLKAKRANGH